MNRLHPFFDFLERHVYRSNRRKITFNIALLILLHLLSTSVMLIFCTRLQNLLEGLPRVDQSPAITACLHSCQITGVILLLVALGAGLIISAMLQYYTAKPIQRIKAVFSQMNTEEADLAKDVQIEGEDELKDLFGGYNLFLAHLREIITKLRTMGIEIAIDSTKLAKKIGQTNQKSEQQAELSKFVAAASNDANIAISEISQSTQYVSEQTSRNLEEAKKTFGGLSNGADNIHIITEKVQAFKLTVEDLGNKSSKIMGLVSLINNISDQTNILSLNATIEAERAGIHGKGFAVVAAEVRDLAKKVKPATETIALNIAEMIETVNKTEAETSEILDYTQKTNDIVAHAASNFEAMIADFQQSGDQLLKIAAAIEELSMNNTDILSKVKTIDGLTHEIADDMHSAASSVSSLQSFTENMQTMVCRFRTGCGRLDGVIAKARAHRDFCQEKITAMQADRMNVFDRNYRPVPGTDPQKYSTQYSRHFDEAFQAYFDAILDEIDGTIYAVILDVNGYLPTHHKKYSHPPTGEFEVDVINSRDKRIFNNGEMEIRRAKNTTPMLLQTNMRDTGEILTDISLPIQVGSRHWGAFIMGIDPAIFIAD